MCVRMHLYAYMYACERKALMLRERKALMLCERKALMLCERKALRHMMQ